MDKKLCDKVNIEKKLFRGVLERIITCTFGKIVMRRGILLGHFLCGRVRVVERFSAHPRHFPSQVSPWASLSQANCKMSAVG